MFLIMTPEASFVLGKFFRDELLCLEPGRYRQQFQPFAVSR